MKTTTALTLLMLMLTSGNGVAADACAPALDFGKRRLAGDEVVIWGDSQQGSIQVCEVAEKIGTIPYEITCGISKRVKREYVGE